MTLLSIVLLCMTALLILGAGVSAVIATQLYRKMLTRTGVEKTAQERQAKMTPEQLAAQAQAQELVDTLERAPHEQWSIQSGDGLTLRARMIPAAVSTDRYALCVHGYTATGSREYAVFFDFYTRLGYNLLLVDNRAHGKSEGEAIGMGVLDSHDVRAWIDELNRRTGGRSRIVLHGVSMGAATVLTVAGRPLPEQVLGVLADCAYTSVWDQFRYQLKEMFGLPPFPVLYVASSVCRLRAGYGFHAFSPLDAVRDAQRPILFVHGLADTFVPTHMGQALYNACTADKDLLLVPGAGHAASYRTDPAGYERAACAFFDKIGMGERR